MSEEQSSGRAAARQCVRAPRSGGGCGGDGRTSLEYQELRTDIMDSLAFLMMKFKKKAWRAPPVTRYCWRGFNTFNQKNNHAFIVTAPKRELIIKYRDCFFPQKLVFSPAHRPDMLYKLLT